MKTGVFHTALRLLCCVLVLFPHYALAGPVNIPGFNGPVTIPKPAISLPNKGGPAVTIPGFYGPVVTLPLPGQLPELKNVVQGATVSFSTNQAMIQQNQPQAIINWTTFDIGADATVQFDQQKNSNWSVLNRIWDRDPSRIFGRLTADGKVYLINQNGILFGPGSKVNVNSLAASALNIKDNDFINNALNFKLENYQNPGAELNYDATVSNFGEITAAQLGSVFLLAPRVENGGIITAPLGQIGLAAGTDVQLVPPGSTDTSRSGYYVIVNQDDFKTPPSGTDSTFGKSVNLEGGELNAESGMIGIYGRIVNHDGIIRSVTAVKKNGQVELRATDAIGAGQNSKIQIDVSPDPETANDSFTVLKSDIAMDGLQTVVSGSIQTSTPPALIEHHGKIYAPSGKVTMNASQRVYLDTGSQIDVSGAWADMPASAAFVNVQLNSVELRDAYLQKGGLLQGKTISAGAATGSSIGDISQAILALEHTALERSISGGGIDIRVGNGDFIFREGASLGFAGGRVRYASGFVDTTMLLSGTKIYSVNNVPANIRIDKILGQFKKTHERFGRTESWSGIYYGGAAPLKTWVNSFDKGGDAGALKLSAATMVLDGQFNGSVERGIYQNIMTPYDTSTGSPYLLSLAQGLEIPRKGNVSITLADSSPSENVDYSLSILSDTSPLRAGFTSSDSLAQNSPTALSAKMLNAADLYILTLTANNTISTAADARILLQPGGSFTATTGQRIEHRGEISVPSGTITLNTVEDPVPGQRNIGSEQQRILLAPGSRLNAAGERVDNSLVGKIAGASISSGQIKGGNISIEDKTDKGQGVFIQTGAVVDVSGGYQIDTKGKVTGETAGSLLVQGSTIMLGGDLRGHALADPNGKIPGGLITLRATNVSVASAPADWSGFNTESGVLMQDDPRKGKLVLAGNRLDDTGFTRVALESHNDIVVAPDTVISTSMVRLNKPSVGRLHGVALPAQTATNGGSAVPGQPDLFRLDDSDSMAYMTGASSFTATAGKEFDGTNSNSHFSQNLIATGKGEKLTVSSGSKIKTAPGGTIALSATTVEVAGTLESKAGAISISAAGTFALKKDASILAPGYNRPDPATTPKGFAMNYQPVSGGNVILSAANGDLTLEQGSLINISGSKAVTNRMRSSDGSMVTFQEAGNPGALSLAYFGNLTWAGDVKAQAKTAGIQGGTLAVSLLKEKGAMAVKAGDITRYMASGFDNLTLKSKGLLQFSESMDVDVGRQLTLDAPEIRWADTRTGHVTLRSPWISLVNSYDYVASGPATPGNGQITLSGQWVDANGVIRFSGFQYVRLEAERDIRLFQRNYTASSGDMIAPPGEIAVAANGNLTMKADRIYPGNFDCGNIFSTNGPVPSDYILHADGTVTILPAGNPVGGPIYSAGGNLTVEAGAGIEHRGVLAAPMGTITLTTAMPDPNDTSKRLSPAPGSRIYLAEGSVLKTSGDNVKVGYGTLDKDNNNWSTADKADDKKFTPVDRDNLPAKGVTLIADETIVGSGAKIDTSGGGILFSYLFRAGAEGSNDPLTMKGRYIVISDPTFQLPGDAIYLTGGGGLKAGPYTLLDVSKNPRYAQYAFQSGAYVIEAQSTSTIPGTTTLSGNGYPLITGYAAVGGTPIRGTRPAVYSVRTAADVLTEGYYDKQTLTSGNAGDITLKGSTTIIEGVLKGGALDSTYLGGKITLSGKNVIVQSAASSQLPADFGFGYKLDDLPHPDNYKNKLTVSADSVSGKGFREVALGDATGTDTVTIKSGAVLQAAIISLAANADGGITIESSSQLLSITGKDRDSGEGVINLATPGSLYVKSGAVLHASHSINLDVNDVEGIEGDLLVDHSAITLKSNAIFFGPEGGKTKEDKGLYLTSLLWNMFTRFGDITLKSGYINIDPNTKQSSYVSTDVQFRDSFDLWAKGSITLDAARIVNQGNNNISLSAPAVNFMNSGNASTATPSSGAGTGTFTAKADNINVGNAAISAGNSGAVIFANFNSIALNSNSDVTLIGKGSLTTGNADLTIKAARVTTAGATTTVTNADETTSTSYTAADFMVYTGANYHNDQNNLTPANTITIKNSGGTPGATSTPGGILEFRGTQIDHQGGIIQVDGGTIKLVATEKDITLGNGAQILAQGTADMPGGQVTLRAEHGNIAMAGAIDVSAGYTKQSDGMLISQGDAGKVTLLAPVGSVVISGALKGAAGDKKDSKGNIAGKGHGGSFVLNSNWIDLSVLNDKLKTGGFNESLDLRARTGNIVIASDQTLTAHHIKLTADDSAYGYGQINVYGKIDASANAVYTDGGTVELYAQNDLNIQTGGQISATGSQGGNVHLSSANGWINVNPGGTVDVSGGSGGTVYLRAQRNDNDMQINLSDSIRGASAVYAEAVRTYKASDLSDIASWLQDSSDYYNANQVVTRLMGAAPAGISSFHLLPGIEVVSDGDITVGTSVDLSPARYQTQFDTDIRKIGAEPGVLTIRTAGDLNVKSNLVDHPTYVNKLIASPVRDSWGFNLVAGADKRSANYMSVNTKGTGNLNLLTDPGNPGGTGTLVYTESAPIRFASGRDTVLGTGYAAGYMINNDFKYNLASYDGTIQGNAGRDLIINGGAIQTATGAIDIAVGRDLQLSGYATMGAIRTTGQTTATKMVNNQVQPDLTQYWNYTGGGNITLDVGRSVARVSSAGLLQPAVQVKSWDLYYFDSIIPINGIRPLGNVTDGKNIIGFTYNGINYTTTVKAKSYLLAPRSNTSSLAAALMNYLNSATDSKGNTITGNPFIVDYSSRGNVLTISNNSGFDVTNFMATDENTFKPVYLGIPAGSTTISGSSPIGHWAADYTKIINGPLNANNNGKTVNVDVTSGLATMGGGDLSVRTGADFLAQAGTFGKGNLNIYAGGDIRGRFLSKQGQGEIHAMGNFGVDDTVSKTAERQVIELFDSRMSVTANGDIFLGAAVNPTFVSTLRDSPSLRIWDLSYKQNTSISLKAGRNVTYFGEAPSDYNGYTDNSRLTILPATVNMEATGGDIRLLNNMTLTPSFRGNLRLWAGGVIDGYNKKAISNYENLSSVLMSDEAPDYVYGVFTTTGPEFSTWLTDLKGYYTHGLYRSDDNSAPALHTGTKDDTAPVVIHADQDIRRVKLFLPKKAEITAKGDITDTWYVGQNVGVGDVSKIVAGRDIKLLYTDNDGGSQNAGSGFQQAGPGAFIVQAGGNIDLGTSAGIQTNGNAYYDALGSQGSALLVIAGYNQGMTVDGTQSFFGQLRSAGTDYSSLMASGQKDQAAALLQQTRATMSRFLGAPSDGSGDINMNYSKIETVMGKSDMFIVANGSLNVGKTAFLSKDEANDQQKSTGIMTDSGGKINIFTRLDVNVNESRVMSFFGGDIAIWSDQGSINAGRGSKTAMNTQAPKKQWVNGKKVWVFTPPAAGSGIRAVTYDPDGPAGPLTAPNPGDIYLFAPSGIIDAGEAGISGGKVVLGATQVINAANVSFSSGSIGVPQTAAATTGIGALSGAGTVAQNSQSMSYTSDGVAAQRTAQAAKMIDDILLSWVEVNFVDFVQNE